MIAESTRGVAQEAVCVQRVVSKKLVYVSVEITPAAFGDDVHDAARRAPEFGGWNRSDDSELLNRVNGRRRKQCDVRSYVYVCNSVDQVVGRVAPVSAYQNSRQVGQAYSSFGGFVGRDPGHQRHQLKEAAIVKGYLDDFAILDDVADRGR